MKRFLVFTIILSMVLSCVPAMGAAADTVSLSGEFMFEFYPDGFNDDIKNVKYTDVITVPGAMELEGYGYPGYYFEEFGNWGMPEDDGIRHAGVYKKEVDVKSEGEYYIVFDSFKDYLTLYVNNEKVGESKNGAIGASFKVKLDKKNEIVIVVARDKSGINKSDNFALSGLLGDCYITKNEPYEKASDSIKRLDNTVLKGVKYTPTHPENGDVITNEKIAADLKLIKEYGFNAVWTSCAPEFFYEEAKKQKLYVVDEANVWLDGYDRDKATAKARCEEMVKKHAKYDNIVMWSVGGGDATKAGELISYISTLDKREVAQNSNLSEVFEVFGNTGGMQEWVNQLGNDNIGGFVEEFADKELYYTKNVYLFETKDNVTGESVTVEGEVKKYKGINAIGDASYERKIDKLDRYTVVADIAPVSGDRVILESGNVKMEIRDSRARFTVGDKRVRSDVSEGKIAFVYCDGEIQLYINGAFVGNETADATLEGKYIVPGGKTGLLGLDIYNDALTLDELIEGADANKLISSIDFDEITVKEDRSYDYLAYGGDFGDTPNSYYKCLTGLFTSLREPHPEAEAFKAALSGEKVNDNYKVLYENQDLIPPVIGESAAVFKNDNISYTVAFDGRITSIVKNGNELLSEPVTPTVVREGTLYEYEMGEYAQEGWRAAKSEIKDNALVIELVSTMTDARIVLSYSLYDNNLKVSMQASFADGAAEPSFIGFIGAGIYDSMEWYGTKVSTYPDRYNGEMGKYTSSIKELGDNYPVPHEDGNRAVHTAVLKGGENCLGFMAMGNNLLQLRVRDYSERAGENADHDEELVREDKAYFRVGGYIKGVGTGKQYHLNDNTYGFDMLVITDGVDTKQPQLVSGIDVNGEKYKEFTTGVYNYVYRTNDSVAVSAEGAEVKVFDDKAVVGDYTIYFAPATQYLSDMEASEKTATIAKDCDFSGNAISMRGNDYWAPATSYDKGVALKDGSVTYDISKLNNHTFSAVIGKNDFDWRRMGGVDRSMFDASCSVEILLDGVTVEKVEDVSMRSGATEVKIDVSAAKEMTIVVTGAGRAPKYEDAILAGAAFVPDGPIVTGFEKKNGKAEITVLNTDEDFIDVMLTATEGENVKTTSARISKGLYRTIEIECSEKSYVKAYITNLGTIELK